MKIYHTLIALIVLSVPALANASNLNTLINQEAKKATQFLNKEDAKTTGYKYHLVNKKVHYADINKDGKKDAVVALYYCEKQSCHMTTNVFDVAVFLSTGNGNYKYGSAYTLGLTGDLTVKNGIIYANTLSYVEHEDPDCCPSHKALVKLKFNNGKLIQVR